MSGKIPSRVRITKIQRNTPSKAGRWGLQGLETCARRNKVLCQYVKRRTAKLKLVWHGGSTLNDNNFLLAIDWWFGIPLSSKYRVPPDSTDIIISIFGQIEDWETNGVTNMANAFSPSRNSKAATFNKDIGGDGLLNGKWDTRNVTTMENMFKGAASFNQNILGTGKWNTSSVTSMESMFEGSSSFKNFSQGVAAGAIGAVGLTTKGMFKNILENDGAWLVINTLNTTNITSMESMFEGNIHFDQDINIWDTSNVTSMKSMFEGAENFKQDITGWTTINVTTMDSMFKEAHYFNQNILGTGQWDTSDVTSMDSMFEGATAFTNGSAPVVAFAVTIGAVAGLTTNSMFKNTAHTPLPDLTAWDPSNVTSMESMFQGAAGFQQNILGTGKWNTSNVTSMDSMFQGAISFTNEGTDFRTDIGRSLPSGGLTTNSMFKDLQHNPGPILTAWITTNLTSINNMFDGSTDFDQDIRFWDVAAITSSTNVFSGATTMLANYNYTTGTTSKVADTTPAEMNAQKYKFFKYPVTGTGDLFNNVTNFFNNPTTSLNTVGLIGNWNTLAATTMHMLFAASVTPAAATFNEDLSEWDTSAVTDMGGMFNGAAKFDSHIQDWDTGIVTQFETMFKDAADFYINISGWSLAVGLVAADVLDMVTGANSVAPHTGFECEFLPAGILAIPLAATGCVGPQPWPYSSTLDDTTFKKAIDWWLSGGVTRTGVENVFGPITGWDTSAVLNMSDAFYDGRPGDHGPINSTAFNEDITNWETVLVFSMKNMFRGAVAFDKNILGTTQWNTSNVTSMDSMFQGANSFTNDQPVPFAAIIGAAAGLTTNSMFKDITGLGPDLENTWKAANVTSMESMFEGTTNFNQNILGGGKWDTSNVISMDSMFEGSSAFQNAGVSFATTIGPVLSQIGTWSQHSAPHDYPIGGITIRSMFKSCTNTLPDLTTWNPSNVTSMKNLFQDATTFNQDIGGWDTTGLGWGNNDSPLDNIFYGALLFDQNLSTWQVCRLSTGTGPLSPNGTAINLFVKTSISSTWTKETGSWLEGLNSWGGDTPPAGEGGFYTDGTQYKIQHGPNLNKFPVL